MDTLAIFLFACAKVFSPDSFNPCTYTFNGEDLRGKIILINGQQHEAEELIKRYYEHPVIIFSSFIGMANRCRLDETPGWQCVYRNLFSLKNLFLPLNLLRHILQLPELFCCFSADYLQNKAAIAYTLMRDTWTARNQQITASVVRHFIKYAFLTSLRMTFEVMNFTLRALFSFQNGAQAAFYSALNFMKSEKESNWLYAARITAGILLATLNLGIFITASIFLPFYFVSDISPALATISFLGGIAASAIAIISTPFMRMIEDWQHQIAGKNKDLTILEIPAKQIISPPLWKKTINSDNSEEYKRMTPAEIAEAPKSTPSTPRATLEEKINDEYEEEKGDKNKFVIRY